MAGLDLSLSNALLDGTLTRRTGREERKGTDPSSQETFPALVYTEPHKALDQRVLFRPPQQKKRGEGEKRRRHSEITAPYGRHSKSWDEVISDFISNKILKNTPKEEPRPLTRSLSWDALHTLKGGKVEEEKPAPKTFVFKPQKRKISRLGGKQEEVIKEATEEEEVPPRNYQLEDNDDPAGPYEVPMPTPKRPIRSSDPMKPTKSPRTKKSPNDESAVVAPVAKPRTKIPSNVTPVEATPIAPPPRDIVSNTSRHTSFVVQDIVSPHSKLDEIKPIVKDGDIGLLKIRVLGMRLPQGPTKNKGTDSGGEEEEVEPVATVTPKDGLFCVLSIIGKHSQFQSSLQPLDPITGASVWNKTDAGCTAVFYTTASQQVVVMCRKLSLAESDQSESSRRAQAECVGVGMIDISSLSHQTLSSDRGSIEDWSELKAQFNEVRLDLEPHGSVLLNVSYTCLEPQSSVQCTGSITVVGLNGVDCYKEGEPCSTCCTVDIDSENYGTTSSKLGVPDQLSTGWATEPIPFDSNQNTLCRIQLWGITSQESEYWFGEVYTPLSLVLPYSDQIVHQEEENGPLKLLDTFERKIVMPIEPKGQITIQFNMSPAVDDDNNINETIKVLSVLEGSGLFKPEALAMLKNEAKELTTDNKMSTITEEDSSGEVAPPTSSFQGAVAQSGTYDHLSPSLPPTSPTHSLLSQHSIKRSSRMTLRLLGSLKLQVPKSYDERRHKIDINTDPVREMEIMKVELKDVKARLATSEYQKEKAEMKIKSLEEEVFELRKQLKKKAKK
ncbi:PREDICTED: uncharacterized protein LOC109584699 [Amphimedon queenslandica]|uniref:Uncharacterized protein n=1 Tax=Amphimedon queenslandica TaxID=400682 RepID=A0A1X7U4F5_AMPQE|nr:PREDICTED: uncharacterized protein LOC109584699 [Amphimedon queenslandica]|eukprot:XP_019856083.1 PREDICTED: uncharacterized protein LOC109584699 [Amphimedon queenslandica]